MRLGDFRWTLQTDNTGYQEWKDINHWDNLVANNTRSSLCQNWLSCLDNGTHRQKTTPLKFIWTRFWDMKQHDFLSVYSCLQACLLVSGLCHWVCLRAYISVVVDKPHASARNRHQTACKCTKQHPTYSYLPNYTISKINIEEHFRLFRLYTDHFTFL